MSEKDEFKDPKYRNKKGQFVKGKPIGRKPGAKNVVTEQIRSAFEELTYNNLEQIQAWLDETAEKNPGKALDLYLSLSERVIPTLSRSDQKIQFEEKIEEVNINIKRNKDD